ncbi:ABC transporter ATP-binding protein [Sphingobacterium sp. SRCM116780]|uniref:ABC transporter ATP-binding protein n=1 Tax=Sphingobacterium sp. SRCM116780 TaxID=2907623 RepID=UPI001F4179C1|nr:ABC transporter ATP-binding protein [Sphingobacterium sp. SRCM116780]UIR57309.1 ABC transporter ATP-binding protein [Sphingobacterium sp. SRCM116780]
MLQFQNFKKQYGDHLVLAIPQFTLEKGVYWLQGENGSGKSSLLKCITGLLPFDGDICFSGYSLKKQSSKYLSLVNYAATEPAFPTFLSGKEIVEFYVKCKKGNPTSYQDLITSFAMEDYLQLPIAQYSSGMLKKLSLVLAFVGSSQFIVLDEPFITLDPSSSKILEQWINYKRHAVTSILFSSHQDDIPFEAIPLKIQHKELISL